MTKRATAGLGAGLVLLAGVLAGCGDGDEGGDGGDDGNDSLSFADQSYDEIKQAALDAMGSLESLHVQLEVTAEEQSFASDLSMSAEGQCSGTVTVDEATAEVIRVDGEGWYKPNREFLEQIFPGRAEAAAEFVGDSWVVDSEDVQTGANCDLEDFVDGLSDDEDETNTEVGGVEDLDGQDVVRLDYTNEAGDGIAYILADGEHYIVKIEFEGDQSGTAAFSEFDEDVSTEAPAEDEIVDLAEFQA